MRAAVVDTGTNLVVNFIVADASVDAPPLGCFLVNIDDVDCNLGWTYDAAANSFIPPAGVVVE